MRSTGPSTAEASTTSPAREPGAAPARTTRSGTMTVPVAGTSTVASGSSAFTPRGVRTRSRTRWAAPSALSRRTGTSASRVNRASGTRRWTGGAGFAPIASRRYARWLDGSAAAAPARRVTQVQREPVHAGARDRRRKGELDVLRSARRPAAWRARPPRRCRAARLRRPRRRRRHRRGSRRSPRRGAGPPCSRTPPETSRRTSPRQGTAASTAIPRAASGWPSGQTRHRSATNASSSFLPCLGLVACTTMAAARAASFSTGGNSQTPSGSTFIWNVLVRCASYSSSTPCT